MKDPHSLYSGTKHHSIVNLVTFPSELGRKVERTETMRRRIDLLKVEEEEENDFNLIDF